MTLAARKPLLDITMAELATEAGVTRATVYNHATTPLELARDLVQRQLRQQRDRFDTSFDEGSGRAAYTSGLRILAHHLIVNADLYRSDVDEAGSSPLMTLLTTFATASTCSLLESHPEVLPPSARPEMVPVLAAAVAHGAVGAIEVWMRLPERDEDELVDHLLMTVPDWLLEDRS